MERKFASIYHDDGANVVLRYMKGPHSGLSHDQEESWVPDKMVFGTVIAEDLISKATEELFGFRYVVSRLLGEDWGRGDRDLCIDLLSAF